MERRRHVVYITRNTEYHCRDHECVGVRERATGKWHRFHPAIRCLLRGGVYPDRKIRWGLQSGCRLLFSGQQTVMTSKLVISARPAKDSLFFYSSLCKSGVIDRSL